MDAVVCPPVKAVVPPFDVIVRSYGQHVDGPAGRRPHCAGNPGVSYVPNKFSKSRGGGAVAKTLEHWCDFSFYIDNSASSYAKSLGFDVQ